MTTLIIPPIRNSMPMIIDIPRCFDLAIMVANKAPVNVPTACARKGKRKCFGSKKGSADLRPSMVDKSVPAGGGMINPPTSKKSQLNALPRIMPEMIAKIRLKVGLMEIKVRKY